MPKHDIGIVPTLKKIQAQFTSTQVSGVMREPAEIRGSNNQTSRDYKILQKTVYI